MTMTTIPKPIFVSDLTTRSNHGWVNSTCGRKLCGIKLQIIRGFNKLNIMHTKLSEVKTLMKEVKSQISTVFPDFWAEGAAVCFFVFELPKHFSN